MQLQGVKIAMHDAQQSIYLVREIVVYASLLIIWYYISSRELDEYEFNSRAYIYIILVQVDNLILHWIFKLIFDIQSEIEIYEKYLQRAQRISAFSRYFPPAQMWRFSEGFLYWDFHVSTHD